jgi:hypothetical protein
MTLADDRERLRRGLVASVATYSNAKRPRGPAVKRLAILQSLAAVIGYIRAQPGWRGLDGQLVRMHEALTNVQEGRQAADWLHNAYSARAPLRLAALKGEAAAHMEWLVNGPDNLGRENAATIVAKRCAPGLFAKTRAKNSAELWKTVAGWRDEIRAGNADKAMCQAYEKALKQCFGK